MLKVSNLLKIVGFVGRSFGVVLRLPQPHPRTNCKQTTNNMKNLITILLLIPVLSFAQIPKKELEQLLTKHNVKHKEIVLKQAKIETGYGRTNNKYNLFGFMYKGKLIKYNSYEDCVIAYKAWQDRKYKSGCYYAFLQKVGYSTNPKYITALKQ